jgi:hypothetical protein
MQFRITRLPDYVEVELTGQVDLQALLALIKRLGTITQANGDTCLLFDLLRLGGDMHFAGQMQTGEQVARCLSHLDKVASVVPAEKITRTSEKVARAQGAKLRVFDAREAAIAWIGDKAPQAGTAVAADSKAMDPARAAVWQAVRHLFPLHAKAIQLPNGTLAISWSIASQPDALYDMAAPITVRLEPALVEQLRMANPEQRKRIAAQQEAAFRAGLVGYDPFTVVPRARVIVLG